MTIRRSLAIALLNLIPVCVIAADYPPVLCESTLTYAGPQPYQSQVLLPSATFTLGNAFDGPTVERLNQAMANAITGAKATAMTAAVASSTGLWSANKNADNSAAPTQFYWASVGKALTATVIMQLVEEDKLSLDDPLSRWLPDFPNSKTITVDHLLQHTAGVFSANEDMVVRRTPRYRSADENIGIAKRHGPMFCPGQYWRYSNTGYEMLGKIISAIEHRPYHEVINARIAERLKLSTLRSLAPGEDLATVAKLASAKQGEPMMAPSWGNAAGNIVASAEDMLKFWHALLTVKLLNAEHTHQLFEQLYPMFDNGTFYGRGVMLYSFVDSGAQKTWLGHSGGAAGVKAVVVYSPEAQAFVAVALTGDGSAEASANLLMKQLSIAP